MDTTTLIRIVAGILAVVVLAFLVYRRKQAKA
jgi:LPXTG-motif cell wall-anchored protein